MITTCHRAPVGRRAEIWTSARISATEIDRPSGTTTCTSACVPAIDVRQPGHVPHPVPVSHSSAAANARAATERPEPGGPVNSHACGTADAEPLNVPATIDAATSADADSTATASGWPTTWSQTVTSSPPPARRA
jgi:adenylate cyclase